MHSLTFLIVTSCKIKSQVIILHTKAQNAPYLSNREECVHSEGRLDQGRKPSRTNTTSCSSVSGSPSNQVHT